MIAKFITAKDIERMFKESGFPIGYQKARAIKKKLISLHSDVLLPNKNVIPLIWLEEAYGDIAYKSKKKKGTSKAPNWTKYLNINGSF